MTFEIKRATRGGFQAGNALGLKHGGIHTATYSTWRGLKTRCLHPKGKMVKTYKENGITVCERWRNSFSAFRRDMGDRPIGMEIDRIDNSKGYEPGNCRWVTHQQNQRNKTNNRNITFNGVTQCAKQWSLDLGIHYATLLYRLRSGWSVSDALTVIPSHENRLQVKP